MAEAIRFVCNKCNHLVVAWSDGNPYYLDELGVKQYAYHPNYEALALCIGNDSPHHCLGCGDEFDVDSLAPVAECPSCGSSEFVSSFELGGCRCPYCKDGMFEKDTDFRCIS